MIFAHAKFISYLTNDSVATAIRMELGTWLIFLVVVITSKSISKMLVVEHDMA
jgi:hypothetical protein